MSKSIAARVCRPDKVLPLGAARRAVSHRNRAEGFGKIAGRAQAPRWWPKDGSCRWSRWPARSPACWREFQDELHAKAKALREANSVRVDSWDELVKALDQQKVRLRTLGRRCRARHQAQRAAGDVTLRAARRRQRLTVHACSPASRPSIACIDREELLKGACSEAVAQSAVQWPSLLGPGAKLKGAAHAEAMAKRRWPSIAARSEAEGRMQRSGRAQAAWPSLLGPEQAEGRMQRGVSPSEIAEWPRPRSEPGQTEGRMQRSGRPKRRGQARLMARSETEAHAAGVAQAAWPSWLGPERGRMQRSGRPKQRGQARLGGGKADVAVRDRGAHQHRHGVHWLSVRRVTILQWRRMAASLSLGRVAELVRSMQTAEFSRAIDRVMLLPENASLDAVQADPAHAEARCTWWRTCSRAWACLVFHTACCRCTWSITCSAAMCAPAGAAKAVRMYRRPSTGGGRDVFVSGFSG